MKLRAPVSTANDFKRKLLLYSPSGVGKTEFMRQVSAALGPMVVASFDNGEATLANQEDVLIDDDAKSIKGAEQLIWALLQKKPEVAHIKVLGLDGSSALTQRTLAEIAKQAVATSDKRTDVDKNEVADYGLMNNRMLRLIRLASDIPDITLVVTAWEKTEFPKTDDKIPMPDKTRPPTYTGPDFTEGLRKTLFGYFDDVWRLSIARDGKERVLTTDKMGAVYAKTRGTAFAEALTSKDDSGKVIPCVREATFDKVLQAYKASFTK